MRLFLLVLRSGRSFNTVPDIHTASPVKPSDLVHLEFSYVDNAICRPN